MAGNVSLEASIRTCKVDPAYASKVQSDRFLNPYTMICPLWNGFDSAGRPACPNSFNTKSAGCTSAQDRVEVENYQRPQYVEYVNLSSGGIDGSFYNPTMTLANTAQANCDLYNVNNITGNYGLQFASSVYPGCGLGAYTRGMQQNAEALRKYSMLNNSYASNVMKNVSGCN